MTKFSASWGRNVFLGRSPNVPKDPFVCPKKGINPNQSYCGDGMGGPSILLVSGGCLVALVVV